MKIPVYKKKTWNKKDYLIAHDVDNIIRGIRNLANAYYKPQGWITIPYVTTGSTFSYNEVNRWLIDLDLMEKEIQEHPKTTIWNGQSFENWDSYDTGLEWEE